MAVQMIITPAELERQANLVYEGKNIRVFLCYDPTNEIQITDSVAVCMEYRIEPGKGGYEDFQYAIPVGYYSAATSRYEIPPILASFNAVEEGYTYDTVIVEIGNANYPHSIIRSSDPVTLSHGQIKTYRIGLIQDD